MKFKIDDYSFGRMVIRGEEFTSDIIIYPDKHTIRLQEHK